MEQPLAVGAGEERPHVPGEARQSHARRPGARVVRDRLAAVGVDHDPVLRHAAEVTPAGALGVRLDLIEVGWARTLGLRLDGDDEARPAPGDQRAWLRSPRPPLSVESGTRIACAESVLGADRVDVCGDGALPRATAARARPAGAPAPEPTGEYLQLTQPVATPNGLSIR